MALIKCPECGKDNVSDTAVSCPNCGFNIREYFENLQADEADFIEKITTDKVKNESAELKRINEEREERNKREEERLKALSNANKNNIEIENKRNSERISVAYKLEQKKKQDATKVIMMFAAFTVFIIIMVCIGSISKRNDNKSLTTNSTSSYTYKTSGSTISSNSGTKTHSNVSTGKSNALKSAQSYIRTMPFSKKGLIEQLEYEGYSTDEATYGAENCGANWKEQAAISAKNYLKTMSFSRSGLEEQLIYEGYTSEEAEYGVSVSYK